MSVLIFLICVYVLLYFDALHKAWYEHYLGTKSGITGETIPDLNRILIQIKQKQNLACLGPAYQFSVKFMMNEEL